MSNFYGNVCQKCGLYISSSTRSCPRCKNYCTNITEDEDEYDFYADTGLYDSGNSDDNLFLSLLLDIQIELYDLCTTTERIYFDKILKNTVIKQRGELFTARPLSMQK